MKRPRKLKLSIQVVKSLAQIAGGSPQPIRGTTGVECPAARG